MSARRGFTLVELLVALTLFAVGLLGCVGTLLAARRELGAAERQHLATQTAGGIADSLMAVRGEASGELQAAWGVVRWSVEAGGTRLVATQSPGDTLLDWWIPAGGAAR